MVKFNIICLNKCVWLLDMVVRDWVGQDCFGAAMSILRPNSYPITMLTTFETSLRLLSVLLVFTQLGLMLRTSSQILMKVNMSTLTGMEASWARVKWYSEFARVVSAAQFHNVSYRSIDLKRIVILTFTALFFGNVSRVLEIVECEYVVDLGLCVDDWASAILDSWLDLLN